MLFVRFVFKKINILNSSLMFDLSLQGLIGDICHSLYLQLLILQKLLVYCCDFQLITSRRFETSFWLKGGRAFRKCIPSNHPITYQRYEKGNRYAGCGISNVPHTSYSTTHYRHDEQGKKSAPSVDSPTAFCQHLPINLNFSIILFYFSSS